MSLIEYILKHAERGACVCGRCVGGPQDPENHQPGGHTVDVLFFEVALRQGVDPAATKEELLRLTTAHRGSFIDCLDPNDGQVHDMMRLGGWLGDQGLALMYMGLGSLLGAFDMIVMPGVGPLIGKIPPELKRLFDRPQARGTGHE